MNREQMFEKAWRVWCDSYSKTGLNDRDRLDLILDAILPQVTTVAELEALHSDAILIDREGDAWWAEPEPHRWWSGTAERGWPSVDVISDRAPLTLVWTPDR